MSTPKLIPSPYHPLHGMRLKLNRAQEYADALKRGIDAWSSRRPYEVFGEYDAGPPETYVFRVRFLEPAPPDWGIVLGDFAHNARSSLDHLAYRVVMHGNGGTHRDGTQFPILLDPFKWRNAARTRLRGATDRHLAIIESLQPYHRPDLYGWHTVWSAIDDPLAVLNRLSIVDKHIVLNATPARVTSIGWDTSVVKDVASVGGSKAEMGILLDGGELVRVGITSCGPDPELKLERHEVVEIDVQHRINLGPDHYTLWSYPVLEYIDAIMERLWTIFGLFVNEFR